MYFKTLFQSEDIAISKRPLFRGMDGGDEKTGYIQFLWLLWKHVMVAMET